MASKGARIGMGAASGAASGAAIGSAVGPWGTAIGGAVGAIGGGLAGLLSASDEAKKRRLIEEDMRAQALEAAQKDWEQRVAAISGLSNNPLYLAMSYEPYDPSKTDEQIKRQMDAQFPEWQPNYGELIGNIASAAGAVGKNARAQDWSGAQKAQQDLGLIGRTGNPWAAYAGVPTREETDWNSVSREELFDAFRRGKVSY